MPVRPAGPPPPSVPSRWWPVPAGALLADLPSTNGGAGFGGVDPFYTVPVALTGVVLVAALLLVVFSMAVHGVESLMDHKRSVASLAVLGASAEELERTQRWEVGLVAMPMAVLGVLIGSLPGVLLMGLEWVRVDPARGRRLHGRPGVVGGAGLDPDHPAVAGARRFTRQPADPVRGASGGGGFPRQTGETRTCQGVYWLTSTGTA